jgi:putative transposase
LASVTRIELPKATRPNEHWSMDFLQDALNDGRRLKVLPIVDDYTHKCHAIEVDTSINGKRVCEVLNQIAYKEGLPEAITIDNGPEFIGMDHARRVIEAWRVDYNIERPHSSLNYMTPEEFLWQVMAQSEVRVSHL